MPELYLVEVAGALRRAEYRGAIGAAQATTAFADLHTGRVHRVQVRPLLPGAWAMRGHRTIADALYVVLSEQLNATLVTADMNLARSPGLTVPTITP